VAVHAIPVHDAGEVIGIHTTYEANAMPQPLEDCGEGRWGFFQQRRLQLALDSLSVEWLAAVAHMARCDLLA
jgi:hypothetical protein